MKNKFTDLHNHLFEQMERLNDDELTGDKLKEEIRRAEAMNKVAGQLVNIGNLVLRAKVAADNANGDIRMPLLLE